MRHLEPFAHLLLLLAALLACGGGEETGKPTAASLSSVDVCAKLVAAKVARNCAGDGVPGAMGSIVKFDVVGVTKSQGSVYQYTTDAHFKEMSVDPVRNLQKTTADDYPEQAILHAPSRIIILWGVPLGDPDPENDRWLACRKHKSAAVCAKAQPAYYNANKALYDAARRAVGAK